MKKLLIFPIVLLMISTVFAQNSSEFEADRTVIKEIISRYATSINNADDDLAGKIFLQSNTISFIHPKGHAKGWDGVKGNIYGMFEKMFTYRTLNIYNEEIEIYGDTAVAVFCWKFGATFTDNTVIQTEGRETQVYHKVNGDWKIVHVHYSHMPVTGEKNGF